MSTANALWGEGLDMTKVMFGERAQHVGMNLIVQRADAESGKVWGVFQCSDGLKLMQGTARTHVILIGDVVVRPRMAMGSDAFRGSGVASLVTCGFADINKWVDTGDLLLPPLG